MKGAEGGEKREEEGRSRVERGRREVPSPTPRLLSVFSRKAVAGLPPLRFLKEERRGIDRQPYVCVCARACVCALVFVLFFHPRDPVLPVDVMLRC